MVSFVKYLSAATLLASASAHYMNMTSNPLSTSTATTHKVGTTVVTVTSCAHEGGCSAKVVTTGVTVVTATVSDIITSYTTYCPLPSAPVVTQPVSTAYNTSTVTTHNIHKTTATITSCHEDKCHTKTVETGVTTVTTTSNNVVTVFTTYCPLTTAPASSPVPSTEEKTTIKVSSTTIEKTHETTPVASVSTTQGVSTTKPVESTTSKPSTAGTTEVKTTSAPTTAPTTVASIVTTSKSVSTQSTQPVVSTFQGAAANVQASALALAGFFLLLI